MTAWDGSFSTAVMDQISATPTPSNATRNAALAASVAVVPSVPGEPPAHFHTALAGNARRHRVEPGEADELACSGDLQRPQAVALHLEQRLDAIDQRIARGPVERRGEIQHRLGVAIESGKWLAVGLEPAPHQQPFGLDGIEYLGLGHSAPSFARFSARKPPVQDAVVSEFRQMGYFTGKFSLQW